MDTPKQQYLTWIRANSAYPTYRGFIGTISLLGTIMAAGIALAAVVVGLGFMTQSFMSGVGILVLGLVYAALVFLLAKFFKEAALILADIGDCTAEANSRTRAPQ